ncbi:hypothetical protein Efla_005256 [Eimeria flavescens]
MQPQQHGLPQQLLLPPHCVIPRQDLQQQQQHQDTWQQQQQRQQQLLLQQQQQQLCGSATPAYCLRSSDVVPPQQQQLLQQQQLQQQGWATPVGDIGDWQQLQLQQQPLEWYPYASGFAEELQTPHSGVSLLAQQQQQQQHLQLQQQQELQQQRELQEQELQLLAALKQQELRLLHRQQQMQAAEAAEGGPPYREAAAGPEAGVACNAAYLTYDPQQQQQQEFARSFSVPSSQSAATHYEWGLLPPPPHATVSAAAGGRRLHVISSNRPGSAAAAAAAASQRGRVCGETRAVVVGCTYTGHKNYNLRGPANDAHLFAHALVQLLQVKPDNVLLMTDALPDSPYRGTSNNCYGRIPRARPAAAAAAKPTSNNNNNNSNSSSKGHVKGLVLHPTVDVSQLEEPQPNPCGPALPTKRNILIALNWLIKDALPGDRLFFFFSGHSTQVDNLSAYEGEGYEEALLPADFDALGQEEDVNLLLAIHIKEVLLSVAPQVHVCMLLDTCGCQTMLDPAGTGSVWSYIKGVKQKGLWPLLTDATNRMQRANYQSQVWLDPNMQAQRVRPRYLPCVEISSAKAVRCPVLCASRPLSGDSRAYLLAAAPWSQVAVEAALPSLELPVRLSHEGQGPPTFVPNMAASEGGRPVVHGVFTWCLVSALLELFGPANLSRGRRVSYATLAERVRSQVRELKWNRLFALDQMPELTIHTGGNASFDDAFYSSSSPAAFSASSSPSHAAHAAEAAAAATAVSQRLSAACCLTAEAVSSPCPSMQCVDSYSFFDLEKAWSALTCGAPGRPPAAAAAGLPGAPSALPSSSYLQQQQQQVYQQQPPYSAAECYRFVLGRQASLDSVASYDTFAPKKQQQPLGHSAAAGQLHADSVDGAASCSSGDSPGPLLEAKAATDGGVGFLLNSGSTLLLPRGRENPANSHPPAAHAAAAAATHKTHCVPSAAAAAAREAYIAAAAKRISEKAQLEAAFGAVRIAEHEAQMRKMQDVAPQATDVARLVVQQQQVAAAAAAQQQQAAAGQKKQPAAALQVGVNANAAAPKRPAMLPPYNASAVPIYEATPD